MPATDIRFKVLVVGIGLTYKTSYWARLANEYDSSQHDVTQRWALVPASGVPKSRGRITTIPHPITSRATLLNALLANERFQDYDYVVVSDDDVRLPIRFLEKLIHEVATLGFGIAQPARTKFGYNSHYFVVQQRCRARQTYFVEMGPIVILRSDLAARLLPFDESNPMTWGQELIWAHECKAADIPMGIIDSVPIDHCLRPVGASYAIDEVRQDMQVFLSRHPHLTFAEAKVVVRRY